MSKYSHAIYVVLVLLGVWIIGCENRNKGYWRAKAETLETRYSALLAQAKTTDTVYHTDTVRLRITRSVTDSILVHDTVIHTDTVRQIVARERAACNAAIQSCEERVAVRDSQIAVLRDLVKVERKRRPSVWGKIVWGVGGVILGRATK